MSFRTIILILVGSLVCGFSFGSGYAWNEYRMASVEAARIEEYDKLQEEKKKENSILEAEKLLESANDGDKKQEAYSKN